MNDYFLRYPEVIKLTSTTSSAIISVLKSIFSRHGIPETVRSDNGPQYSSDLFAKFANTYDFKHITSSPLFAQSNGQVERMVQTVKQLLKRSEDPYMALMSYCATPLPWCDRSPTELLMGRKIRTSLPQMTKQFVPGWTYIPEFKKKDAEFKRKQKANYDDRHRVRELPEIPDETSAWIRSDRGSVQGKVVSPANTPRSYIVDTPSGQVRRNRNQLTVVPQQQPPVNNQQQNGADTNQEPPRRICTRSQTGTMIHPPERLA